MSEIHGDPIPKAWMPIILPEGWEVRQAGDHIYLYEGQTLVMEHDFRSYDQTLRSIQIAMLERIPESIPLLAAHRAMVIQVLKTLEPFGSLEATSILIEAVARVLLASERDENQAISKTAGFAVAIRRFYRLATTGQDLPAMGGINPN